MNIKVKVLLFSFLILELKGKAQMSTDIFGVIPIKKCGWGMGLNLFSPGLSVGNVELRIGGGIYGSSLVKRNVYNVPLDAPQIGDATVHLKNNIFGFDGILRISLPYSNGIVPYLDLFAGQRLLNANMNIAPDQPAFGYQASTSRNLGSVSQVNYGATFGILASLSETFKFNIGMMYTYSPQNNDMINVDKARLESGSVVFDNKAIPHGMFIAKVGFTFMLTGSGSSSGFCRTRSSGGGIGIWRGSSGGRGGGLLNGIRIGGGRPLLK
jgi:hypothetical protein